MHHHGPVQMLANKLPVFARYQPSYQSDNLNDCISVRSRGAAFLSSCCYLGRENKRPEVQLNVMCVSIAQGVSPARRHSSVAKTKLKQQLISTEIKSQGTCGWQAALLCLLRGPLYEFVVVVSRLVLLLNDCVLAWRHLTRCIQVCSNQERRRGE